VNQRGDLDQEPIMSEMDWEHYEIPLAPPAPAPASRPAAPAQVVTTPLARRGDRLFAAGFDLLLCVLIVGAAFLIPAALGYDPQAAGSARLVVWGVGLLALTLIQWALVSLRGQTLGKMLASVRIVNYDDGANPGFLRAVVMRGLVPSLITAVPCLGIVFGLIDILSIFGEERRCLHDRMAGTKVVQV
jgi:uncharacterized RDD family membrane protein YckC